MAPGTPPPAADRTRETGGTNGLALAYGAALLAVGAATAALGEVAHWTALIPAMLGGIVLLVALAGRFAMLGERVVGGAALALSVLALAGTLSALPLLPAALSGGEQVRNTAAVLARAATAMASLLYIAAMAAMIARRWRDRRSAP